MNLLVDTQDDGLLASLNEQKSLVPQQADVQKRKAQEMVIVKEEAQRLRDQVVIPPTREADDSP